MTPSAVKLEKTMTIILVLTLSSLLPVSMFADFLVLEPILQQKLLIRFPSSLPNFQNHTTYFDVSLKKGRPKSVSIRFKIHSLKGPIKIKSLKSPETKNSKDP